MSLNKVLIIGNLGSDPELKTTSGGQSVATFNIATNRRWTDKAGQNQEQTEWHRIVVWGRQAENCQQYLSKGRQVFIEGRIQTRQWEDKEGQKRYTTEIVAQSVQFLNGGGRGADTGAGTGASEAPAFPDNPPKAAVGDDDIPF